MKKPEWTYLPTMITSNELAKLIETLAPRCGPRWMRDARERGIERCIFWLTKAYGLGFEPHDIEQPILWEGDYRGFGWPLTAAQALVAWQRDIAPHPHVRDATRWFVPFMEKLASGEDFGFA